MPASVQSLVEVAKRRAQAARPKFRLHNCSQDPTEPPMQWRTDTRKFVVAPGESIEVGDIFGVPEEKAYDKVRKGIDPVADKLCAPVEEVVAMALLANGERGLVFLSADGNPEIDETIVAEGIKTWTVYTDKKSEDIVKGWEKRRTEAARVGTSIPSMTTDERRALMWRDKRHSEALRKSGMDRQPCPHRCGFDALTTEEMKIHLQGSHPHDVIPGSSDKPIDQMREEPVQFHRRRKGPDGAGTEV